MTQIEFLELLDTYYRTGSCPDRLVRWLSTRDAEEVAETARKVVANDLVTCLRFVLHIHSTHPPAPRRRISRPCLGDCFAEEIPR